MGYVALYRQWRPHVFEDVVEQEHIVKTLRNSITAGRIAHAYLFCGTRGTGKTTMAQIFSRAINCLAPRDGDPCNECEICSGILSGSILDVVEIDAASNNSVDNVREIRDEVIYAPTHARYKVYIIDEVHMLSTGAFNALLKTLEEPPERVVFILATTEPHKLPATILSRCQRFDFKRITAKGIADRLELIASQSGAGLGGDAAKLIARIAEGAMRDAISILDQCISAGGNTVSYDSVLSVTGMVDDECLSDVVGAVRGRDAVRLLKIVDGLVMDGRDIGQFVSDLVLHYRNLLICRMTDKPADVLDLPDEQVERIRIQCEGMDGGEITDIIRELSLLESGIRRSVHPRVALEVTLIRLCSREFHRNPDDVAARLADLERRLAGYSGQEKPADIIAGAFPGNANKSGNADKGGAETTDTHDKPAAKLIADWEDILSGLRTKGRMALYSFLLDTNAYDMGNDTIGIVFKKGNNMHRNVVLKPENLESLMELLREHYGRQVVVRCMSEDERPLRSTAGGTGTDNAAAPVRQGGDDSKSGGAGIEDKARELADGFNVPLNIIDE